MPNDIIIAQKTVILENDCLNRDECLCVYVCVFFRNVCSNNLKKKKTNKNTHKTQLRLQ